MMTGLYLGGNSQLYKPLEAKISVRVAQLDTEEEEEPFSDPGSSQVGRVLAGFSFRAPDTSSTQQQTLLPQRIVFGAPADTDIHTHLTSTILGASNCPSQQQNIVTEKETSAQNLTPQKYQALLDAFDPSSIPFDEEDNIELQAVGPVSKELYSGMTRLEANSSEVQPPFGSPIWVNSIDMDKNDPILFEPFKELYDEAKKNQLDYFIAVTRDSDGIVEQRDGFEFVSNYYADQMHDDILLRRPIEEAMIYKIDPNGNVETFCTLSDLISQKSELPRDKWNLFHYIIACDRSDKTKAFRAFSQECVGRYFEEGKGVAKTPDLQRALTWYERAAESGSAFACARLASYYAEIDKKMEEIFKDQTRIMLDNCERTYKMQSSAIRELEPCYSLDLNKFLSQRLSDLKRNIVKSQVETVGHLKKCNKSFGYLSKAYALCDRRDTALFTSICFDLGWHYETGKGCGAVDHDAAILYYGQAQKLYCAKAQSRLDTLSQLYNKKGLNFHHGSDNHPVDHKKAVEFYVRSIRLGGCREPRKHLKSLKKDNPELQNLALDLWTKAVQVDTENKLEFAYISMTRLAMFYIMDQGRLAQNTRRDNEDTASSLRETAELNYPKLRYNNDMSRFPTLQPAANKKKD